MENLLIVILKTGVQLIAQVETILSEPKKKKEDAVPVGYVLRNAFLLYYEPNSETNSFEIGLGSWCPAAASNDFTIRESDLMTYVRPVDSVIEAYTELVQRGQEEVVVIDGEQMQLDLEAETERALNGGFLVDEYNQKDDI